MGALKTNVIDNHIPRKAGGEVLRRIEALKIGQKMQDLPEELWHKSFRYYVKEDPTRVGGPNLRMIRLDPAKPSLTVTGYIFNKFVHPYEDRFVTVREASRLQGFPDDFRFVGTLTSTQMQVGNAVPVPLAKAVAQAVLDHAVRFKVFSPEQVKARLPVLSLFSGAGGLDIGVGEAQNGKSRWRVAGCVERDHDCCNTLRDNFAGQSRIFEADITGLEP
ncbi:MAG: DNA cytosine methyltransferase, partial [bacterium]